MDLVCPAVAEDPSCMFHSVKVEQRVNDLANKLNIDKSKIMPIINYKDQIRTTLPINMLALLALRHLLGYATDVLDNMSE